VHRSVSSFSAKKDNTEGDDTMAKPRMDLSAFVGKLLEEQDGDVLREGIRVLSQALMESEVAGLIGAERHERTDDRKAYRNGSRTRTWDTRVGTIELAIPKVTPGTYFPSLLQPRRRAEHALLAVVQEAWVHGVSTRKVDDLVKALGIDGISKSEVSRICGELDTTITAFRTRPLTGEHRYVWVDATYHKVRVDGRVTSQATVVAVGITSEGERQVLGVDVGPSEDRSFWTAFLRSLVKRGLKGVRLVISDAHEGLKQAIATVLSGTAWQRCRVHFMRNLLATVPHGAREAVAAIVRTIFAQPDHASALQQLKKIAEGLRSRFAKAATLLEEAAEDILAYRHVPLEHQRQLHSTNPLERLNKEIKRRSNVVGIFPNPASVLRLVGAVLLEQDDEWAVAERRYFSAESMKQLNTPELAATTQEILATVM
jgi:putative transposase